MFDDQRQVVRSLLWGVATARTPREVDSVARAATVLAAFGALTDDEEARVFAHAEERRSRGSA